MKNKKSLFSRLMACMLVLVMVFSLTACGDNGDNPSGGNSSNPGGGGGGENNPPANATTYKFEAEYAKITGSVPGLVSVFFGASNNCWLDPIEGGSNGYGVTNLYVEGNEDNVPVITFTIVSDAEAEATIALCIGANWEFDASFNTTYLDTNAGTDYPLTFNGTALSSSDKITGSNIEVVKDDDDNVIKKASDMIVANYGTVTLKQGENTFTITATAGSKCIDYLQITTTAKVTMEEDHTHTYRVYSEDDFEYVEKAV